MSSTKKQLPHLVFGGELVDLDRSEFVDLGKLDLVGLNEGRARAQALRLEEREHHATTCTKESSTESTRIFNLIVLKYLTLGA